MRKSRAAPPMTTAPQPEAAGPALRRRGLWSVLDQGMSSATNLGLFFLVLTSATLEEFGAFTISLMTYQVILLQARALVGEPLLIRHSHQTEDEQRLAARAATGTAVVLTIPVALVVLIAGAVLDPKIGHSLIALAVTLPGLMLQDTWRQVFFATARPALAFANDTVWGVTQIGVVLALLVAGDPPVWAFVLAWGLTGGLAGALGVVQARLLPALGGWRTWLRDHRDLGGRYFLEALLARPFRELSFYAIGAIAGLAVLGAIQGARVFIGPARVFFVGLVPFAVAEGVRIAHALPERFVRFVRQYALAAAAVSVAMGLIAYFAPVSVMERLIDDWAEVRRYVLPVTAMVALQGVSTAGMVGLRALAAAKASLKVVMTMAPVTLGLTIVGALIWGGPGGVGGLATAMALRGFLFWRSLAAEWAQRRPTRTG